MKRFSIVPNGYDIDEVNNFVDVVIKRLEKLNSENASYLSELSKLKEEVQKSKDNSSSNYEYQVTQAIIAANETANRMKQVAKDEASLIVNEAKDNATAIVHEALVNAQKTEQDAELLKKNVSVYMARVKSLTEAQLKLLDDMDKKYI
jgi:cell division initiation protein